MDRRVEMDMVQRKVETTKKEIDQLKASLQQLITTGINTSRSVKTEHNNKENLMHNVIEKTAVEERPVSIEKHVDVGRLEPTTRISRRTAPKITLKPSSASVKQDPVKKSVSPSRNTSRDREKAREYIKKQREKRLQETKTQVKNTQSAVDIKKQKLKELQQKSLKIVQKNVEQKRKRSKSRENEPLTDTKFRNVKLLSTEQNEEVIRPVFENVTVRKNNETIEAQIQNITVRPKSVEVNSAALERRNKAAVIIQTCFRGYRQRKAYKIARLNRRLKPKTVSSETQTQAKETKTADTPVWLQPSVTASDPYSFIKTVKRKLQFVVNSPKPSKSDVAIQSDINNSVNEAEKEVVLQKAMRDVKELIEKNVKTSRSDLKTFLSHKCLNMKLPEPSEVKLSKTDREKSHSSKIEESIKNNGVPSDSDTSKNIPNISSESSGTISTNKRVESALTELSVKKPTDPPTDSDLSEYKLDVNTERLKNLQLRRKKYKNTNFENTIHVFQNTEKPETDKDHSTKSTSRDARSTDKTIKSVNTGEKKQKIYENVNFLSVPPSEPLYPKAKSISPQSKISDKDTKLTTFSKDDIISFNISNYSKPSISPNGSGDAKSNSFKKSVSGQNVAERSPKIDETQNENLKSFQVYMKNINNFSGQLSTSGKTSSNSSVKSIASKQSPKDGTQSKTETQSKSSNKEGMNTIETEKYSSNFTDVGDTLQSVLSLQKPAVNLDSPRKFDKPDGLKAVRNFTLTSNERTQDLKGNPSNQIHLKIEAELHLLNDFNDALGKCMALEKSVLELQQKNEGIQNSVLHNRDTQTSLPTRSPASTKISEYANILENELGQKQIANINYSRGSEITESILSLDDSKFDTDKELVMTTGLESTCLSEDASVNEDVTGKYIVCSDKQPNVNQYFGLSLGMFEQLIKDEDTRIQNLKTILKIREKTLLDRTKGELTWLEIQKKQLKETGQLHEVSLVKKKQRGILMRLQHEQHEMQKLKHMQKIASKERKTLLREQRNMIKAQLSTNSMLKKMKITSTRESQRSSGPFKVYSIQSQSESIRSETSVSRNSITDEIFSVTSHSHSVRSRVSEVEIGHSKTGDAKSSSFNKVDQVKRTLLMREAALQKRRKAAEELLQWHQKLLEEEKRVAELETIANSIVNEAAKSSTPIQASNDTEHAFRGAQLNVLWQNMTGREDKKFNDLETYSLSQIALQNFCKDAKKLVGKIYDEKSVNSSEINKQNLSDLDVSKSSDVITELSVCNDRSDKMSKKEDSVPSGNVYTSDFEVSPTLNNKEIASATENTKNDKISSISELIDNLTKINEEISLLSKRSSLNKSIDSELDNLGSSFINVSSNNVDSEKSKNKKVEINKLLVLKENLNVDNSNAILDSIQSLKSSIQKITSKADSRHRNSEERRRLSENDKSATDKDISDLTSKIVASNEIILSESNTSENAETIDELASVPDEEISRAQSPSTTTRAETHVSNEKSDVEQGVSEEEQVVSVLKSPVNSGQESSHKNVEAEQIPLPDEEEIKEIVILSEPEVVDDKTSAFDATEIASIVSDNDTVSEAVISEKVTPEVEKPASEETATSITRSETSRPKLSYGIVIHEDKDLKDSTLTETSMVSEVCEEENEIVPSEDAYIEDEISVEQSYRNDEDDTEKSPKKDSSSSVDVKKRVSEIMAEASVHKNERSPRFQDIYVTTYDLASPDNSPRSSSPSESIEVHDILSSKHLGNEAEELLKKQLAIEQEIKQLEQQQQKEHIPYLFMREIPNKPPPPYTPPVSATLVPVVISVLPPTTKQVDVTTSHVATILFNAYAENTLDCVKLPGETLDSIVKNNVDRCCVQFLFDMCKEIAIDYYSQFKEENGPSWMKVVKKSKLCVSKFSDERGLAAFLNKKLKQLLGFEKIETRENSVIKWSRKKRDHVDEILIVESQAEESEWTNYDRDELFVKNEVTNELLNMLLSESAEVLSLILKKKSSSLC